MAINKLSSGNKIGFAKRTITGVILMLVLIPTAVLGSWPFFILHFLLAIVAIHEILAVPGKSKYNPLVKGVVYLFVLSFIYWGIVKNWLTDPTTFPSTFFDFTMSDLVVSVMGIILYALILFLIAIFTPKVQLSDVTFLFTMGLIIGLGFVGIYFLRFFPNSTGFIKNANYITKEVSIPLTGATTTMGNYFSAYWNEAKYPQWTMSSFPIIALCIGTWGGDVGAYLFGMLFGKHRMNPRISPHKTWEGFIYGSLFGAVLVLGFAAILEFAFHIPLIPGLLQFSYSEPLALMHVLNGQASVLLVLVSLMIPVVGNVGGFLFSLIKRQYGIKDFGKVFPGHGGVIDRFDSVLINSIVLSIVLLVTAYGWNLVV